MKSKDDIDKIVEVFFEFLRHMEDITDVMEAMAKKMEEMDLRIKALEKKPRRKNGDDEQGMPRIPY